MSISQRTATSGTAASSATFTVSFPSGVTDGDLLVVVVANALVTSPNAPSGWTKYGPFSAGTNQSVSLYTAPWNFNLGGAGTAQSFTNVINPAAWACNAYYTEYGSTPTSQGYIVPQVYGTPVATSSATNNTTMPTGIVTTPAYPVGMYEIMAYAWTSAATISTTASGSTIDRTQANSTTISAALGHNNTASLTPSAATTAFSHTLSASNSRKTGVAMLLQEVLPWPLGLAQGGPSDDFNTDPLDTVSRWSTFGTPPPVQSGGTLRMSAPASPSTGYLGLFAKNTSDYSNAYARVEIVQLPSNAVGSQMYLRLEVDANNAAVFGYGDNAMFAQKQIAGATTTTRTSSWPAGTRFLRLSYESSGTGAMFYDYSSDGTIWTQFWWEALATSFGTSNLRVVLGTGTYVAIASPGTAIFDNLNLIPPVPYKNLSGTSAGGSTAAGASSVRRSLVANSAGVALAVGRFAISGLAAGRATANATIIRGRRVTPLPLLALTDDFNDGSMAAIWTTKSTGGVGGTIVESGGGLNVTIPANAGVIEVMRGYATAATYDLTNKAVQVELVQRGSLETSSQACLRVEVASDPANKYVEAGQTGASIYYKFTSNQGAPAWPAGARFLRIEFDNGPTGTGYVYWDWSANGSTWTAITTSRYPVASLGDVTACRVLVIGKSFLGNVTAPLPAIFDNFDILARPLSGTATGVSTAAAPTLTRKRDLGIAASAGATSLVGALTTYRSLAASAAGAATLSGAASRARYVVGISPGAAIVAGTISARRSLVAASPGAATVSVQVTRRRALVAASPGVATVSVQVTRYRALVAASAGTSTVTTIFGVPSDDYGALVYNHPNNIAYWRLGETSGTSARDSSKTGGHHATYVGAPILGQAGAPTNGVDSSPNFNNAGYVDVPDFAPGTAGAVEAWIKVTSWTASSCLINRRTAGNVGGFSLEIAADGIPRFHVYSTGWNSIIGSRALATNVWHHIVGAWVTGQSLLMVNGEDCGRLTWGTGPINNPAGALFRIGYNNAGAQLTSGQIDEVAVYNTAIPDQTMRDHYAMGVKARNLYGLTVERTSGLVGRWTFDELGLNIFDHTGNGRTGTLTGTNNQGYGSGIGPGDMRYLAGDAMIATTPISLPIFSVEAWFYPNGVQPAGAPCIVADMFPPQINYCLKFDGGGLVLHAGIYQSGAWHDTGGVTLITNSWAHCVMTYDGAWVRLYVNGVQGPSPANWVGTPISGGTNMRIGRRWDLADYVVGYVDEVAVYNRVLTASEISEHYTKGVGGVWRVDLAAASAGKSTANARAPKPLPLLSFTDDWEDGVITPDKWLPTASGLTTEQLSRPWGVRV